MLSELTRTEITGDWRMLDEEWLPPIPAYVVKGEHWNGWSVPYVDSVGMATVLSEQRTLFNDGESNRLEAQPNGDIVVTYPDDGSQWTMRPVFRYLNGRTIKLWPIGDLAWCWFEFDADELRTVSGGVKR